ncbi:MAG: cell division protein FtsK [Flavobacteriales bacterium]|nr:cell division protein FtsK [Flavobacteriales bacterium]
MKNNYYKLQFTFGIILFTISIFLFISFNSYWKYGVFDQSEIIGDNINFVTTQNTLGGVGAQMSEYLIRLFGITAYLLISLVLLTGLRIVFSVKKINIVKTTIYHIFFFLWIPLLLSICEYDIISGEIGITMANKLTPLIGTVGIILLLITTLFIFLFLGLNLTKNHVVKFQKSISNLCSSIISTTNKSIFLGVPLKIFNYKSKAQKNQKKIIQEVVIKDDNTNIKTNNKKDNSQESEIIVKVAEDENTVNKNKIGVDQNNSNKIEYKFPELDLLKEYAENKISIDQEEVEDNKKLIEDTLKDFKIDVKVQRATVGPTITLYEIIPDEGVRISKIKNLENDIALRIKAVGVRIIAPLPGKGTVGIEVPNQNPTIVSMKNVIASEKFQTANLELPIALGKTIANETFIIDLTKMPHLLIAGATGQGKSVGLNTILCSILYKKHPNDVKFILIDPKKVELTLYNRIESHFLAKLPNNDEAIITDTKSVVKTLKALCVEMDNRYDLLKKAEVRNIQEYNKKHKSKLLNSAEGHKFLPYLVLVIDEFADLIMTAGKEVEIPIARLAQLSRAIGIHLIIATQRPTTNIITGTIKANFPTRIAFRVIQGIDSKTILDTVGANQLIGRGDMLISTGSSLSRIQCAFIDTSEVEKLTDFISRQDSHSETFVLPIDKNEINELSISKNEDRDPLFKEAALLIIMHQQGSTSMIQRKLKLGYNRAGRIIDQLEDAGVLGPLQGSKGRQVLIQTEEELNQLI